MRDTRRSRIVLAILVLVSITLIVFDLRGGGSGPTRPLRAVGETFLGSAERAMATFIVPVRGLLDSLGGLGDTDERIAQLNRIVATEAMIKTIISELPLETLQHLEERFDVRFTDASPMSTLGVPPMRSSVQNEKPLRPLPSRASDTRTHASTCLESCPTS